MELTTSIGPLQFRLASVQTAPLRVADASPFLRLEDGSTVQRWTTWDGAYLLVDYRVDPDSPARIELWECVGEQPELPVRGLLALCDAAASRITAPPAVAAR